MITKSVKSKTVRWAVVGTGDIASTFADDIRLCSNAELVAVCSRTSDKAAGFSHRFGPLEIVPTIEALAAAPGIEAVYIATPNTAHFDTAMTLITAGKPLLVEKPLTTTAAQARALAQGSANSNVFVMEGLWTVFLPAVAHLRQIVNDGVIGAIRSVRGELAFLKTFDPNSRFFSPELGGGSLLDLGIYPIALTLSLFGNPQAVTGHWRQAGSIVDMSAEAILSYRDFQAHLSCGFDRDGTNRFMIEGTKGTLAIDAPFLKASRLLLARTGLARKLVMPEGNGIASRVLGKLARTLPLPGVRTYDHAFSGNGLQFEIEAASRAILDGKTSEPSMPLDASVAALEIIETILSRPAT